MTRDYSRSFIVIISLLFIIVRLLGTYRTDIGFDLFDSPSYFNPTWSYPIRMPFITYIFTYLSNFFAIVFFQTIFSISSWLLLAFAISIIIGNSKIKKISVILILSLGITAPVVGFDSIILSESLTISLFNYIMALTIIYFKRRKNYQLLLLLFFIIFYAGIKQSSAHISMILILLILIFEMSNFKSNIFRRFQITALVMSIFVCSFFIWLSRQNSEISGNVEITNIIERTFDDYESQKLYLDKGFPGIAYQQYSSKPFESPVDSTRALPQVKAWEMFEKRSPIEHFAINNPLFLTFGPLIPGLYISAFTENESVIVSLARGYRIDKNFSVINLKTSEPIPFFLDKLNLPLLFWWSDSNEIQKNTMIIFFSTILLFYMILYSNRFKIESTTNYLISNFLFVFFIAVWSNWHISVTYELGRYLMPWAIELRIIFIITLCIIVESLIKRRSNHED